MLCDNFFNELRIHIYVIFIFNDSFFDRLDEPKIKPLVSYDKLLYFISNLNSFMTGAVII